jgi:hypothetical protein
MEDLEEDMEEDLSVYNWDWDLIQALDYSNWHFRDIFL